MHVYRLRSYAKTDNVMHLAHMCRLVVLMMKRFIYDAMDLGYMEVPPRWGVTPVGRVTKGEVAPKGSYPKVEESYLDLAGPWYFFQGCVTAYAVMLQDTSFWLKCQKLMVSWLLCICKLVSTTDNVMHLAHTCRLVVLMKRFIYDSGYTCKSAIEATSWLAHTCLVIECVLRKISLHNNSSSLVVLPIRMTA